MTDIRIFKGDGKRAEDVTGELGDRIKARFMGGRNWYPGVVSMLFSDGTHGISYDDGDREARVPRSMIQLLPPQGGGGGGG